ncbi:MAG: hypothetical protein AAFN17_03180, partial [Pseudomonadota bacterium]
EDDGLSEDPVSDPVDGVPPIPAPRPDATLAGAEDDVVEEPEVLEEPVEVATDELPAEAGPVVLAETPVEEAESAADTETADASASEDAVEEDLPVAGAAVGAAMAAAPVEGNKDIIEEAIAAGEALVETAAVDATETDVAANTQETLDPAAPSETASDTAVETAPVETDTIETAAVENAPVETASAEPTATVEPTPEAAPEPADPRSAIFVTERVAPSLPLDDGGNEGVAAPAWAPLPIANPSRADNG